MSTIVAHHLAMAIKSGRWCVWMSRYDSTVL